MDTTRQSDVVGSGRGRKMGVMGGRSCARCGVVVGWRVEKFCNDQRMRFGGRVYCIRCQAAIPA